MERINYLAIKSGPNFVQTLADEINRVNSINYDLIRQHYFELQDRIIALETKDPPDGVKRPVTHPGLMGHQKQVEEYLSQKSIVPPSPVIRVEEVVPIPNPIGAWKPGTKLMPVALLEPLAEAFQTAGVWEIKQKVYELLKAAGMKT